ncbi:YheV family putative zinc ribbon protein [Alteromonas oceanisediminis]|uniref:YheV family putative zinc ribbon protein n=1 Tax=Alteromonas oceanisediminis TaxID=2836180 RepID=UPI001BDA60CA|nr:YheV family putative zinc ribbon protein [Alteromonas oceanisediminis]MBT0587873.1 YheV family putative metal-binding protein [Alteromonas oceanisediminis]
MSQQDLSAKRTRKRFIAGAICPECKKLDTLMLYFENNVEQMECAHCGYHQSQSNQDVKTAAKGAEGIIGVFKPE